MVRRGEFLLGGKMLILPITVSSASAERRAGVRGWGARGMRTHSDKSERALENKI